MSKVKRKGRPDTERKIKTIYAERGKENLLNEENFTEGKDDNNDAKSKTAIGEKIKEKHTKTETFLNETCKVLSSQK